MRTGIKERLADVSTDLAVAKKVLRTQKMKIKQGEMDGPEASNAKCEVKVLEKGVEFLRKQRNTLQELVAEQK